MGNNIISDKYGCIICVTPFHIFTSINLCIQFGYKFDLFIMDTIPGSKDYIDRIKKTNIFNDVKLLSRREMWDKSIGKKTMYLSALSGYFKVRKMIKKHIPRIDEYTDVFIPCMDIPGRFIYCYKKKYNDNIKIHIFDEGIGSYIDYAFSLTKFDYLARRVIIGKKAVSEDFDVYLYSPEFYLKVNNKGKYKINKIDVVDKSYTEIIKCIFLYDDNYKINKKYIIFDTVRSEEGFSDGGEYNNQLFNMVLEKTDNVIVKPHPRDVHQYFKCDYYLRNEIPFEVICYLTDFSDKCLITVHSSACYYPKLLFNQEPRVMFLYKPIKPYVGRFFDKELQYMNALKKIYDNSDNVLIPDSIEMYKKALDKE